jgi:hypothetical protein
VHVPSAAFAAFGPLDLLNLSSILDGILGIVLTAGLAYGVVQDLRGRPTTFLATVGQGLRRVLPATGAGAIAGAIAYAPAVVAALLANAASEPAAGLVLLASLVTIVIQTALWVTVPAAVLERVGVVGALGRSLRLTRGNRWRIFGVMLVLGMLFLAAILLTTGLRTGDETDEELRRDALVGLAVTVVLAPLFSAATVVGYHDLRGAKEGVDVEDLAKVFE